jgi:ABC-type multidrug transport system ATPase subunit
LIATHRLEEAVQICNKVLVIDRGRVRAFDCIADLIADGITISQYYRRALAAGAA